MPDRAQTLTDALADRILVLDGAMGTMIHQAPLSIEKDYQGHENCPEILDVTRPDVITGIHRAYLEAGADIVETDTFGGTGIVLAEIKLEDRAYELNFAAAKIARQAADEFSTPAQPRFVAGSMGPTTKDLNITATTTFSQLAGRLLRAGQGAGGRRRGLAADRDVLRHRKPQSRPAGRSEIPPRPGLADSRDRIRDHRAQRHHAGWPAHRRAVCLHRE